MFSVILFLVCFISGDTARLRTFEYFEATQINDASVVAATEGNLTSDEGESTSFCFAWLRRALALPSAVRKPNPEAHPVVLPWESLVEPPKPENLLGEGGFGSAWKLPVKINDVVVPGAFVVMKTSSNREATLREHSVLRHVASSQHAYSEHVVRLVHSEVAGIPAGDHHILLEYANGGDFHDFMNRVNQYQIDHGIADDVNKLCSGGQARQHVPVEVSKSLRMKVFEFVFFLHALRGLQVLHDHRYVHMDLKLDNIMLNFADDTNLLDGLAYGMLIDMGVVQMQGVRGGTSGTLGYMAPEILADQNGGNPLSDSWSMGVILYILIFRRMPDYAQFGDLQSLATAKRKKEEARLLLQRQPGWNLQSDSQFVGGLQGLPPNVRDITRELLAGLLYNTPSSSDPFGLQQRMGVGTAISKTQNMLAGWVVYLRQIGESTTANLIETMVRQKPSIYGARRPLPHSFPSLAPVGGPSEAQRANGSLGRTVVLPLGPNPQKINNVPVQCWKMISIPGSKQGRKRKGEVNCLWFEGQWVEAILHHGTWNPRRV